MFTKPAVLLRVEDAFALVVSILLYSESHTSRILFAVLFLSPDLFMLGYLVNTRIGAAGVAFRGGGAPRGRGEII